MNGFNNFREDSLNILDIVVLCLDAILSSFFNDDVGILGVLKDFQKKALSLLMRFDKVDHNIIGVGDGLELLVFDPSTDQWEVC